MCGVVPTRQLACLVTRCRVAQLAGKTTKLQLTAPMSAVPCLDRLSPLIPCPACSGGMVFTFYKARGLGVGSSLVEEDQLELAKKLEKIAKEKGVKVGLFWLCVLIVCFGCALVCFGCVLS